MKRRSVNKTLPKRKKYVLPEIHVLSVKLTPLAALDFHGTRHGYYIAIVDQYYASIALVSNI